MTHFLQDNDPAWCPATLSHTKPFFPEPELCLGAMPVGRGMGSSVRINPRILLSRSIPEFYYSAPTTGRVRWAQPRGDGNPPFGNVVVRKTTVRKPSPPGFI